MKDKWASLLTVIFSLALVLVLLLALLEKIKSPCGQQIQDTDTVTVVRVLTDTVYKVVERYVPKVERITDTVTVQPDTAAILALFDKIYHYTDTVSDSCLTAVIEDQVFRNEIVDRQFSYFLSCQKETFVTSRVFLNGFYAGPMVGGSAKSFSFGGSAVYVWDRNAVGVVLDGIDREVYVSYYWRIGGL